MLRDKIKEIDKWIILAGLLYIILPIIIFLLQFTRPTFYIIGTVLFVFLIIKVMTFALKDGTSLKNGFSNAELLNKKSILFIISSTLIFCVWIYFSGVGSFSFQNWDFWVRNPIYNDLINKSWPMYYNLGTQSENVTSLIGGEWVAFAYYFTFWLTPACMCKVMHLSGVAAQIILYLYSLVGIIIAHYLLCRLFKKFSWKITALFMTFSGLDVLAYILHNLSFPPLTEELEWSLVYYQLSGNTTQLYYVFNQSIPIWIMLLLILNLDSPKLTAALSAICFAYSPWATIGLVPIALVNILNRVDYDLTSKSPESKFKTLITNIKNAISVCNIAVPIFMLVVFGLYYTASSGSDGGKGLYYFTTDATVAHYIFWFIVFVLTEFGLYYIAIGRKILSYKYSITVFIELLLFPLFYVVDFNFFIRGTIPALFILMIIIISYICNDVPTALCNVSTESAHSEQISESASTNALRKKILTVLLIIGALNSVIAFTRSAIKTAQGGDILQSDIATFDDMSNANEYQILTTNSQFFVHGFATKPFYVYISKIGL